MSPFRLEKFEKAIRTVLKYNEAFNRHDVAGMVQFISDDCVVESADPAPDGAVYSGKEAISQYFQDFFRRSPQARIEIEDIFGFGERCTMVWRYEWLDGEGKERHLRGVDLFQVKKDGLIDEILSYVKGER